MGEGGGGEKGGTPWSAVFEQKKNDEKGYFFQEGQCAALCIVWGRKNADFVEKGYVFLTSLLKHCDKGVC